jgi:membrane-bound lytic murein transglycosylase B
MGEHRMKLLAGAGIIALLVLVVALLSAGPGASASGVSPALAGAPPGLVAIAFQAGEATGIDPNVLLAIAKVETDWGQARNGQPDDLVPPDVRASIDVAALQPGRATMLLLGLAGSRRIGDWVNPQPVGPAQEHAVGFMQFLPSTWRPESVAAPGSPHDPYRPAGAMVTAGSYLHRLETARRAGCRTTCAARWPSTAAAWRTRTRS